SDDGVDPRYEDRWAIPKGKKMVDIPDLAALDVDFEDKPRDRRPPGRSQSAPATIGRMASGIETKLDEIEESYEQAAAELAAPDIAADPDRLRNLGKRFAELQDVVVP